MAPSLGIHTPTLKHVFMLGMSARIVFGELITIKVGEKGHFTRTRCG